MSSKPPFIAQERSDTCMLACLRMLLAHHGSHPAEAELLAEIAPADGGIDPDQLARLANRYGLNATVQQFDLDGLRILVEAERYPIVVVDRTTLDKEFAIHAVVPIRISSYYVTFLDPLRGQRRVSLRRFAMAMARVGGWAVVW